MYRAIVELGGKGVVILPKEEAHHLVKVRRAKPGTRFLGLAEEGRWLLCELDRVGPTWIGRIIEEVQEQRESPLRIVLAQALIKKDKFEWVIQKAVELGVAEIVPLITCRTEVLLDERGAGRKIQRWRKIMLEAVKQCGRSRRPLLREPEFLADFAVALKDRVALVLDEEGGSPLRSTLGGIEAPFATSLTVLVGPEGGWDASDREILSAAGAISIDLGPRILRSETAPVAMLSILQYELGDMGGSFRALEDGATLDATD